MWLSFGSPQFLASNAWTFRKISMRAKAIVSCEWYWNMNFSTDGNCIQQSRQKFEEWCAVVSENAASLLLLQGSLVLSELIMIATFCLLLSAKSGIGLAFRDCLHGSGTWCFLEGRWKDNKSQSWRWCTCKKLLLGVMRLIACKNTYRFTCTHKDVLINPVSDSGKDKIKQIHLAESFHMWKVNKNSPSYL